MKSFITKVADFKTKYFTNNFYWVDQSNYATLQNIGIELGCLNPSREPFIIQWHDSFKNLGFRTYERNKGITIFQKEAFLLSTEEATDYNEMLAEYKILKEIETQAD